MANGLILSLAEGTLPEVDGWYIVQIISRVLHLLSAMIMVGGLFYLRTVLAPAGTEACFAGRRSVWARWVGAATIFLLTSGAYNLTIILAQSKATETKLPPTYLVLLLVKFLLALFVMFVMAILTGKTDAADRFCGQMQKWLNMAWLAAMAIVVLAAIMRTFH